MPSRVKNKAKLYYDTLPEPLKLRLESFMQMENTRIYSDRRFRFLTLGVLLAAIIIFTLPDRKAAQAKTQQSEAAVAPSIDLSRDDLFLADHDGQMRQQTITLASGDSLGPLLQKNGIAPDTAYQITEAFSQVYDPRRVRAGQSFNLHYRGDNFTDLTYKPNIDQTIFISRSDGNDFASKMIAAEFSFETVSLSSSIQNSLYLDAKSFGVPDKVIQQFANIYEYSVDFQRDIQPGDEFAMVFEIARDKKGQIVKSGDLLFTSFAPRGKKQDYYLYQDAKGRENFYDASGKTAKRKLRATPINGARLSSRYGKRKHPILGYRKMHTGVDFAAPRGTPILAAGTGTVEFAGRNGGYGKYIRIRHNDGYKTAYAHMSKFAGGIRKGKHVRQDQIIGYVGSTGRSTGPHLHYEVHHNNKKINPRRLSQLSGRPLSKSEIPNFKKRRAEIEKIRTSALVLAPMSSGALVALSPKADLPEQAQTHTDQTTAPVPLNQ